MSFDFNLICRELGDGSASTNVKIGELTWAEIATILNTVLNKSQFTFHHKDPTIPGRWVDRTFYASNFNMAAQTLKDGEEKWTDLSINVRRVEPI